MFMKQPTIVSGKEKRIDKKALIQTGYEVTTNNNNNNRS